MAALLAMVLVVWFGSEEGVLIAEGLGSMSSISASYGSNGPAFCGLRADSSRVVDCFGGDASVVYGAPHRLPLVGVTAGDGFTCGLTQDSRQPYCWGNDIYVQQGVPSPRHPDAVYSDIAAGDNHLCALRTPAAAPVPVPAPAPAPAEFSVDCWGYNMTGSYIQAPLSAITAGSLFACGLFVENGSAVCWGDETGSRVISRLPRAAQFESISAGGSHVCGILRQTRRTLCWGSISAPTPSDILLTSIVGGRYHACGLFASNHTPFCWGEEVNLPNSTPAPSDSGFLSLVAGEYYTCGVMASSLRPACWGTEYPAELPLAVSPGVCSSTPCGPGQYSLSKPSLVTSCTLPGQSVCVPCSVGCPPGMLESSPCRPDHDRKCTPAAHPADDDAKPHRQPGSTQSIAIIGMLSVAVLVVGIILVAAYFRFRRKPKPADGSENARRVETDRVLTGKTSSFQSSTYSEKAHPLPGEPNMTRAEAFALHELARATGGFGKGSEIGKGSFACVYKGVLSDGRVVAVKRASVSPSRAQGKQPHKDSTEFRNELDLLSRLNHAHLLNLLGFCEDGDERLLVYEFMANGTLHEQLHGEGNSATLGWICRVTVAVQAARGLEYLHGYACPPVIHRDIKSSNILLDEEWNARVSDFGLSLLGPQDSNTPLSELPAGTLGYLDPEYYRLHYLTTKSDVYSFGVLLLEILSGRKAIDMEYEEGNIVEWAVPLIKGGEISSLLDPRPEPPPSIEAMQRIAKVAGRCVKMKGKDRPDMGKVTTALERALAILMGTPSDEQLILPSEVVLGSSRLHRKGSHKSLQRSHSEVESSSSEYLRHSSSLTFPSLYSSQRRKSSGSDNDGEDVPLPDNVKKSDEREEEGGGIELRKLEILPASPREQLLFLSSNY